MLETCDGLEFYLLVCACVVITLLGTGFAVRWKREAEKMRKDHARATDTIEGLKKEVDILTQALRVIGDALGAPAATRDSNGDDGGNDEPGNMARTEGDVNVVVQEEGSQGPTDDDAIAAAAENAAFSADDFAPDGFSFY